MELFHLFHGKGVMLWGTLVLPILPVLLLPTFSIHSPSLSEAASCGSRAFGTSTVSWGRATVAIGSMAFYDSETVLCCHEGQCSTSYDWAVGFRHHHVNLLWNFLLLSWSLVGEKINWVQSKLKVSFVCMPCHQNSAQFCTQWKDGELEG